MGSSTGDSLPASCSAPTAPRFTRSTFLGTLTICCWLISQYNCPGWNPTTLSYDDPTLPYAFSAGAHRGHERKSASPAPTVCTPSSPLT